MATSVSRILLFALLCITLLLATPADARVAKALSSRHDPLARELRQVRSKSHVVVQSYDQVEPTRRSLRVQNRWKDAAAKYASKKVNQAANRAIGPLNKAVYTATATKHLAGAAASVMNAGAWAGKWIEKKADKRGNNAFVRAVGRAAGNGAVHMEVGRDRAREAQSLAAESEREAKGARDAVREGRDRMNNMLGRGKPRRRSGL
ncbi:hypothetical protein DYB32_010579 [Aphanomyces invadans]|uniref:RxLR effector protein n=1 Tax=Aphanomyces invadans TaxID=157072 RepID=A0A3R6YW69_9STRA|nr:hypothetical protein DYB32_010579 [Aphanomyces invadans]